MEFFCTIPYMMFPTHKTFDLYMTGKTNEAFEGDPREGFANYGHKEVVDFDAANQTIYALDRLAEQVEDKAYTYDTLVVGVPLTSDTALVRKGARNLTKHDHIVVPLADYHKSFMAVRMMMAS